MLLPLLPLAAIASAEGTGQSAWFWMPIAVVYGLIPALDWLVGTDRHNPPEAVVPDLERDSFYRWLIYAAVPIHVAVFLAGFWYAMTQAQGWTEILPLVLSLGFVGGLAIIIAMLLGISRMAVAHRRSRLGIPRRSRLS